MVCVLVSFKKEISGFLALMEAVRAPGRFPVYRGRYRGVDVRVARTGMGGRSLPGELLEGCDLAVSTGFCGALRGGQDAGDLVVSREVTCVTARQLDRLLAGSPGPAQRFPLRRVEGAGQAADLLSERPGGGTPVHLGRTVTAARVARSREEKERLGSYFQALAVDMEDFFRLGDAAARGVPCLCVRAVLDRVADRVPDPRGGLREGLLLPARLAALKKGMDRACAGIAGAVGALVEYHG
jgi:nucleoside phosphorylase